MSSAVDGQKTSGVVFPPPFYYLIGIGAGVLLSRFYPKDLVPAEYLFFVRIAAAVVIFLAILLAASAILKFKRAGTNVQPIKPTLALVTAGPYRFTRNPMYLGLALAGFGIAMGLNMAWAIVGNIVAMVCIDRIVILKEERYLESKFGGDYLLFKRRVRRWL